MKTLHHHAKIASLANLTILCLAWCWDISIATFCRPVKSLWYLMFMYTCFFCKSLFTWRILYRKRYCSIIGTTNRKCLEFCTSYLFTKNNSKTPNKVTFESPMTKNDNCLQQWLKYVRQSRVSFCGTFGQIHSLVNTLFFHKSNSLLFSMRQAKHVHPERELEETKSTKTHKNKQKFKTFFICGPDNRVVPKG